MRSRHNTAGRSRASPPPGRDTRRKTKPDGYSRAPESAVPGQPRLFPDAVALRRGFPYVRRAVGIPCRRVLNTSATEKSGKLRETESRRPRKQDAPSPAQPRLSKTPATRPAIPARDSRNTPPASSEPPTPFSRRGRFPAGAILRGLSAADAFPKTFSCGGVLPWQTGAPENCSAPSAPPGSLPGKERPSASRRGKPPLQARPPLPRRRRDAERRKDAPSRRCGSGPARDRPPPCRSRQN